MYEIKWANPALWARETASTEGFRTRLDRQTVASSLDLTWEEHCIECTAPECYSSCPLYRPRADGKCVRLLYGAYPNPAFRGLYEYGADMRFRKWAKLECEIESNPGAFDEFVIECYSPETTPFRLVIECQMAGSREPCSWRRSLEIQPGPNFHRISVREFPVLEKGLEIRVHPDASDQERRVVFTWLDFVRYKEQLTERAPFVKCVAWDLDHTLWDGILSETADPRQLRLRDGVREALEGLDERGIIQVIVSKNDHLEAWSALQYLGVAEYFVQSAINWEPKGANLRALADKLRIGVGAFALIDDSAFERDEVRTNHSSVRTYSESDVPALFSLPEFDVPITTMSRTRRISYLAENRREEIRGAFAGDYSDFLRSCRLKLRIFTPRSADELARGAELMARSNRLNLSNRKLNLDALRALVEKPGVRCYALQCEDRFGDYGLVGLALLQGEREPHLTDFVLSCRVAQKRVEHAFMQWLVDQLRRESCLGLSLDWVDSGKNRMLRDAFGEFDFQEGGDKSRDSSLYFSFSTPFNRTDVIEVIHE